MLVEAANSRDRNVTNKEVEKIPKHKNLTIEIQRMWSVKNESDTINNRGIWIHLTIIQKIPEEHTRKK
jgi:hypothetical protein